MGFSFIRKNVVSICLITIALMVMTTHSLAKADSHGNKQHIKVCKDVGHCVTSEVAVTRAARFLGLMSRNSLLADRGMLFIYPYSGVWRFWMKNTKMPLDIIWMNKSKRIVYIVTEAQPCVHEPCLDYIPAEKALYVLELASGVAKKWDIKIGDRLTFEIPKEILRAVE
jgi:uncharacterized membrane protein (UPF0127 family)